MLSLTNVSAGYGDIQVLSNVSLSIEKGEAVALLGRNGMGKTTTLLTIMGLVSPTAGQISFRGENIGTLEPYQIARRGIGYSPEGRKLFQSLTVEQNLRIPFFNKNDGSRSFGTQLEMVFALFPRLRERRSQLAGSLSGGEQQMCAIARAMIGGDDLLLLDEPTEGIAPAIVESIVDAMTVLKQERRTILLVEQNVDVALQIASRAYIIEKGRIVVEGAAANLAADRRQLERYLGVGSKH